MRHDALSLAEPIEEIDHEIDEQLQRISEEKAAKMAAKRKILEARLDFGRQTSLLARQFPLTKLLGQEIAKRYPASQCMDAALRSNCRWLYEALHQKGHPANDILIVLQVSSIYDVGSENPVTLRRLYNKIKKNLSA